MRLAALLILSGLLAACGDGSSARLASSDVTSGDDPGCIAQDTLDSSGRRVWKVRDGDTLRGIARRVYGDEKLWKSIRDANPGRVTEEGGVRAGAELVIPFDGI